MTAEAYTFHDESGPKRLTSSNPWLGEGSIAKQEVIKWKASLDGQEIQGILIPPLQKPSKPTCCSSATWAVAPRI